MSAEGTTPRGLRAPIPGATTPPLSEEDVQRIWRSIRAKRARPPRRAARRVAAGLAFAAAAAALVLFALWVGPRAGRGARGGAGPLTLAGGSEIGMLQASPTEPAAAPFELSDGSVIELSPGARLSALESTDRAFSALLSSGRALLNVKKGGPRRWSIECGLATVEVVGTRFVLDRSAARVRVEVLEGVVLVRGERVPDRVRRLVAGEALEIAVARAEALSPAPLADPSQSAAPATTLATPEAPVEKTAKAAGSAPASRARAAAPSPAWRELARSGDYKEAYKTLGAEGLRKESASGDVDTLLSLADIARLSGHPADAVSPLLRVAREHPSDPRAPLSAFTLGRLYLDPLGQPARAAASLRSALDLGLGAPLSEDARASIVLSLSRAGDAAGAEEAAADYERRFPNGRRLKDVRRWAARE